MCQELSRASPLCRRTSRPSIFSQRLQRSHCPDSLVATRSFPGQVDARRLLQTEMTGEATTLRSTPKAHHVFGPGPRWVTPPNHGPRWLSRKVPAEVTSHLYLGYLPNASRTPCCRAERSRGQRLYTGLQREQTYIPTEQTTPTVRFLELSCHGLRGSWIG